MSEKDYKTYNDFYGKNVPKTKLASLCVDLREIIEAFANGDAQIKETFDEEFENANDLKVKIQSVREKVNVKLNDIIKVLR